jgi:hypothetical protein
MNPKGRRISYNPYEQVGRNIMTVERPNINTAKSFCMHKTSHCPCLRPIKENFLHILILFWKDNALDLLDILVVQIKFCENHVPRGKDMGPQKRKLFLHVFIKEESYSQTSLTEKFNLHGRFLTLWCNWTPRIENFSLVWPYEQASPHCHFNDRIF